MGAAKQTRGSRPLFVPGPVFLFVVHDMDYEYPILYRASGDGVFSGTTYEFEAVEEVAKYQTVGGDSGEVPVARRAYGSLRFNMPDTVAAQIIPQGEFRLEQFIPSVAGIGCPHAPPTLLGDPTIGFSATGEVSYPDAD